MTTFKLVIICGGPSAERGISLNSARSVMDHLWYLDIDIIYVTQSIKFYPLSSEQLYSNTPEDFDFKIHKITNEYSHERLISVLQSKDMVLPLIHGEYGEDGTLQSLLEKHEIPFMSSSSKACQSMFFKDNAQQILMRLGYPTLPMCDPLSDTVSVFLSEHKKVVIKPQAGGSSIGVSVIERLADLDKALAIIPKGKAVCEAYCSGVEFTVMVIEGDDGPVAMMPTEVEIPEGIYDYRRKYLPTANTRWHCPPRLDSNIIEKIMRDAEAIFQEFGMQDFARLDGWVYQGEVIFSDLNPISGMEQNSFMFLQASRLGMTHQDILLHILKCSCKRFGINPPKYPEYKTRKQIPVFMGGSSEERQVSLMSGTNVWLKLRQSGELEPLPYFLDHNQCVWVLPYTFALHHTCEEVYHHLQTVKSIREAIAPVFSHVRQRLGLKHVAVTQIYPDLEAVSVETFCKKKWPYIFLALHGGFGEDGRIQAILEKQNIAFNGSCSKVSKIAMNKVAFGRWVNQLRIPKLSALNKYILSVDTDFGDISPKLPYIIKPVELGCSVGITVIQSLSDYNRAKSTMLTGEQYFAEAFIQTDKFYINEGEIHHTPVSGWIELTIVVTETNQQYQAMIPSITVAKDAILSMEEKFQGGTGINITPPSCISQAAMKNIMHKLEILSSKVGLKDYARYDLFYNLSTEEIIVIEMNSLPALTPSTVLYQQVLATKWASSPRETLERISGLVER